jgi:hypothetical protein
LKQRRIDAMRQQRRIAIDVTLRKVNDSDRLVERKSWEQ